MKIPKKFKLFNHDFSVIFQDDLNKNHSDWGVVNFSKKEIKIDAHIDNDFKEQTFLHELTHLIFDILSEKGLKENEKLVNNFSELLYQAFETMEY